MLSQGADESLLSPEAPICDECGEKATRFDENLYENFKVRVCYYCKQDKTLELGLYQLLSKSKANKEYALPESSFTKLMHICKTNPHNENFSPLKLYLRKHLMEEAIRLYGSERQVEEEKSRREKRSYDRARTRVQSFLRRKSTKKASGTTQLAECLQNTKKLKILRQNDHFHQFSQQIYDDSTSKWFKKCDCGIKVEFEKW
uniref:Uncharacterized protein AlNc14C6G890 n=1 Tax=Albugo laibachii Nc14 TaxID=890382 RepID=F0W1C1_9STRA|nr:conserved hypothetical protein [Albugo laibachii Nc14]|eukprot:CCA14849.1 conserved hypothetical protein [Albugo laibachii Nc14]